MGLTTDPHEHCLHEIETDGLRKGQQKCYLVLSNDELAKGFVRPVRDSYLHKKCGSITSMGDRLAETYARDPLFYGGTFCVTCGDHFDLTTPRHGRLTGNVEEWHFLWCDERGDPTTSPVGS